MKTKIYLISGKMGSGKSTFAQMLSKHLNDPLEANAMVRFADPLKDIAEKMTGIIRGDDSDRKNGIFKYVMPDYSQEQKDEVTIFNDGVGQLKLRAVLQSIGTDCMRDNLDSQVWIKMTEKKIEEVQSNFSDLYDQLNIIIPDCRFPNEVCIGENMGIDTKKIRIERPMAITDEFEVVHESETALDEYRAWTWYVQNKSGLEYLNECAKSIANNNTPLSF